MRRWDQVSVVIVTHNSARVVRPCIASVASAAQLIVVDNCSADETVEAVRAEHPSATVIRNTQNAGYGVACNQGLGRVRTPYVMFLNPDATIGEGAVTALLRAAHLYPDGALFGPAMHNKLGKRVVTHDASRIYCRPRGEPILPDGDCCVDFLLGAVLLGKTDVLRGIGGFDEEIFLFYEDDDLCLRIRKAGYSVIYVPEATARHLYGHSSPPHIKTEAFKAWHLSWSRLYVLRKHRGSLVMAVEAGARLLRLGLRGLYLLGRLDTQGWLLTKARMGGLIAFLLGRRSANESIRP